jgi:hypothetical protein
LKTKLSKEANMDGTTSYYELPITRQISQKNRDVSGAAYWN